MLMHAAIQICAQVLQNTLGTIYNHFMVQVGEGQELIVLTGVEATVLNGGAVLCHPEWPVPLVSRVIARLLILEVSRPILRGQQVTHQPAVMQDLRCYGVVWVTAQDTQSARIPIASYNN